MNPDWMQRYSRQMLFAPIGSAGQNMLQQKKAAVVGMGALGTVLANHLARAGCRIPAADRQGFCGGKQPPAANALR